MNIKEQTKNILEQNNLKANPLNDQHFLINEEIIQDLLKAAEITNQDIVLEIGSGTGNITREIAKRAKKVIATEIDIELSKTLMALPENVELQIGDARRSMKERKDYNKIVSNIPYQIAEQVMQILVKTHNLQGGALICPKTFAENMQKHQIINSFFKIEILKEVQKKDFYPEPNTSSVIITIKRKDLSLKKNKAEETQDAIIRELWHQKDKRLKNALREVLIQLTSKKDKEQLTKRTALELINKLEIDEELLATKIESIQMDKLREILVKIKSVKI